MKWVHNIQSLKERRRDLRKKLTKSETVLWNELRNNKLGQKFKRQHSIGGYIVDFYCRKNKLIIELEGDIHQNREVARNDKVREKFFKELGYNLIKFRNYEVEDNLKKVVSKIRFYI